MKVILIWSYLSSGVCLSNVIHLQVLLSRSRFEAFPLSLAVRVLVQIQHQVLLSNINVTEVWVQIVTFRKLNVQGVVWWRQNGRGTGHR